MLDLNIVGHIWGCVSTQLNKIKKKIKKFCWLLDILFQNAAY